MLSKNIYNIEKLAYYRGFSCNASTKRQRLCTIHIKVARSSYY